MKTLNGIISNVQYVDTSKMGNKSYIAAQFDRIVTPSQNHIAGKIQIKGDCGGITNWLNISASDLAAIETILENSKGHN